MKVEIAIIDGDIRRTVPCKVEYDEVIHVNPHDRTVNIIKRAEVPQHFNGTKKGLKLKF